MLKNVDANDVDMNNVTPPGQTFEEQHVYGVGNLINEAANDDLTKRSCHW